MEEFPDCLLLSLCQLCKRGMLKHGGGGERGRGLSAQLLLLKNQAKAHKNQHARHTWVCMALFLIALCEVHQSKHVSCCLY